MPSIDNKQRPRRLFNLSTQIAGGYVFPIALTLIALGFFLHQQITNRLWTSTETRMLDVLFTTIGVHERDTKDHNVHDLLLDHLGHFTPFTLIQSLDDANQSARIIDISGKTVAQGGFHVGIMPMPPQLVFDKAKLLEPLEPPYAACWLGQASNGNSVFCLLIPISLNGFPDVYLQMFSSWRTAEEITHTLNSIMLWSALGSLVLGVLCSWLISGLLCRPLEKLARTARLIEKGDLSARTGIDCSQLEISEVATAFDQMVGQLEQSFASQKRFVADASHELRTPLTAISGMAELLEDASPEEAKRSLAVMNREIGRMGRLINDLLCLSRAENSGPGFAPEEQEIIDMHKLLREVIASAQPANFDKEISLTPPVQAFVMGNADNLARVFHNLIGNAQKYAPGDSPIDVSCTVNKNDVVIAVRDHGPGIPEQDLPRVFERFFRSDASRNRKTGGSGLGLAIVQALTEAVGGHTAIRNHPEGGLEITVIMPRIEQEVH